ncbi:MAG: hypothetical protein JST87_01565 [Bacteroidetes bacterium]|nr:hypothetical protein [Bacteroidota bacterium]
MMRQQIDKLFTFLYCKNEIYTSVDDIRKECFNNDNKIDVEAICYKLEKDGYALKSTKEYPENSGYKWLIEVLYKLSFEGKLEFEKWSLISRKKPYRRTQITAIIQSIWAIAKTIAAISVTVITLSISYYSFILNRKNKEVESENRILKDSIQKITIKYHIPH